jgi:hypothetical protein
MNDYLKIQALKISMKRTYKKAVEMYAQIVKHNRNPKDWQRALECVIEINNCLDYVATISKCASMERENSFFMGIYTELTQTHDNNSKIALTVLFEMVLNLGGTL